MTDSKSPQTFEEWRDSMNAERRSNGAGDMSTSDELAAAVAWDAAFAAGAASQQPEIERLKNELEDRPDSGGMARLYAFEAVVEKATGLRRTAHHDPKVLFAAVVRDWWDALGAALAKLEGEQLIA